MSRNPRGMLGRTRLIKTPVIILSSPLLAVALAAFPTARPVRLNGEHPPPTIDGVLDDALWQSIESIDRFHQIRPGDGAEPTERTEVRLAYDEHYFYVGLMAHDSQPHLITANGLIQGQRFFSDDRFEIRFDTFNDRRNAYFFQVNANGIRREALVGNDYWIEEWDTVWFAGGDITDDGWTAEMAIPFKAISFDPAIDTWGLNFSRVIPRKGEEVSWSSQERRLSPAVSGFATELGGMEQGIGVELVPSLAITDREIRGVDGAPDDSQTDYEPSLTAFYRFTPFLTGAFTLNTDFSATEVDDRQINLSRFSLFFPEKREFFLQDASIFEFAGLGGNGRPFFSRTIGLGPDGEPLDLNVGLKLTGRAGDFNVGALAVRQDGFAGEDADLFVGRVTRNVQGESEVGAIFTRGSPDGDSGASLFGVDYNYQNSDFGDGQSLRGTLWYQESDLDDLSIDNAAFGARLDYPNDRYNWEIDIARFEQNFAPPLGFVNRTGVDRLDGHWRIRNRLEDSRFQWLGMRVQYFRANTIGGGLQSERAYLNVAEGFTHGNDFFTVFVGQEKENLTEPFNIFDDVIVDAGGYSFPRYGVFFETGQQRPVSAEVEVVDGDFFDGTNLLTSSSVSWRPNSHFNLGLGYTANRIDLPGGKFTTRLGTARANIAFNSDWAWLNLIQVDNFSDTVALNSRLRWQPRPDREFVLVLNQVRDRVDDTVLDTQIVLKGTFNLRF